MKRNLFLIVFFSIFAVVGISVTIFSFKVNGTNQDFIDKSETTQATITDISTYTTGTGDDRRTDHRVFVTFKVDGKTYTGEINSYSTGMHVGGKIKVYYNPADPDDFMSKSDATGSIFAILVGLLFALVGIVPIFVMVISSIRQSTLKRNGEVITAQIDAVRIDTSVTVNGRCPWNIYCSCFDPLTGEKHYFKSKNFYGEYDGVFENAGITTVDVYVKPGNYKNYYVDHEKALGCVCYAFDTIQPANYE